VNATTQPAKYRGAIGKTLHWGAASLSIIGTIWIALLMLVIVADVLGRNFFNSPITGVAEVAARSVVAIAFLQVSAAVLNGRMTRSDMLLRVFSHFSPRVTAALELLFALVGAMIFLAVAYAVWPDTVRAYNTNEYFGVRGVFTVPTLPFRVIIIIGAVFASLAYLVVAVEHLRQLGRSQS
jgi:TRAP-type C4-dicarboxylate transport system permease small subunit